MNVLTVRIGATLLTLQHLPLVLEGLAPGRPASINANETCKIQNAIIERMNRFHHSPVQQLVEAAVRMRSKQQWQQSE